jgi:hypothetical protein
MPTRLHRSKKLKPQESPPRSTLQAVPGKSWSERTAGSLGRNPRERKLLLERPAAKA